MEQKPSMGRTVHFVGDNAVKEPAIITRVWTDVCVNLKVIPDGGAPYTETSVLLRSDTHQAGKAWMWPERV